MYQGEDCYAQRIQSAVGDVYVHGFFCSEKYFKNIEDEIRNDFVLKEPLSYNSRLWEKKIHSEPCSVSLHIRRGDYLLSKNSNFAILKPELYYRALDELKKSCEISAIFVFSNDIQWCQENFKFDLPVYYVDGNDEDHGYEDMYLMSQCTHNIIANSTFSWWAAWLNPHRNKKVICPRRYYNVSANTEDLYPAEWIQIDN